MIAKRGITRRAFTGGAAAIGTALLAACGTSGGGEAATPKTVSGPRVLSYTTFNDVSTTEYKECNQVFSEKFGGVQIEPVVVASSELVAKLTAQLVSGSLTDVSQVNIALFPALAKAGLFKPISPFLSKDKEMSAKDFFQGHVQAFTWKGQQLGLTGGLVDQNVIFVNKSAFGASGVKVPTPQESQNWTWTNVIDLAKRLTKSDGSQYGL
ncbi:MAG: ABC transporter substrate-binding protein, partial [Chloroflexota bacterium]